MVDVKGFNTSWITTILGAPMRFDLSARSGGRLTSDHYADVTNFITRMTHRRGGVWDDTERLDWRNISDVESMQITVQASEEDTQVRILADYAAMTFFAFFAILFSGMFIAAAIGGFVFQPSTLSGMAVIAAVGAIGSYAAARAAWKGFAQKRHRDLQRLLEALVAFVDKTSV